MKSKHIHTVQEVLAIVWTLSLEDRKKVLEEIQRSLFDEKELLNRINAIHKRYEATCKGLA